MTVPNERTPYLQELIRFSSQATLLIPTIVLDEEIDVTGKFKGIRNALNYLKNDNGLIIDKNVINEDFIELTIKLNERR